MPMASVSPAHLNRYDVCLLIPNRCRYIERKVLGLVVATHVKQAAGPRYSRTLVSQLQSLKLMKGC